MTSTTTNTPDMIAVRLAAIAATGGDYGHYADLDASGRRAVRNRLESTMADYMRDANPVAFTYRAIIDGLPTSASARRAAPVDYRAIASNRAATLRLAADLIDCGVIVPDGCDYDATPSDTGAAPTNGTPSIDAAFRIASAKIGRSATRRDVNGTFERARNATASGEFRTVNQIATLGADGDYQSSDGAVAMRLWPVASGTNEPRPTTVVGWRPVAASDAPNGVRGAIAI